MSEYSLPVYIPIDPEPYFDRRQKKLKRYYEDLKKKPVLTEIDQATLQHAKGSSVRTLQRLYLAREENYERALRLLPSFMDSQARLFIPAKRALHYPNSFGHLYYPQAPSDEPVHAWIAASLALQVVTQYLYALQLPLLDFRAYYDRIRTGVGGVKYRVWRKWYRLKDLRLPVENEPYNDALNVRNNLGHWLRRWLAAEYEFCTSQDGAEWMQRLHFNSDPLDENLRSHFKNRRRQRAPKYAVTFYLKCGFYPWLLLHAASLLKDGVLLACCPACQHVFIPQRKDHAFCNPLCRKRAHRERTRASTSGKESTDVEAKWIQ